MLTGKLQLKPGMRFVVVNAPDGFARTLGPLPQGSKQGARLSGTLDLVLLFALHRKDLKAHWQKALGSLNQNGLLWVAYPKRSSGIDSDLSMTGDWEVYKGSVWQPVASISVDDTWTAVRFKYAPGLDQKRAPRDEEVVHDTDGTPCIDRKNRVITPPKDLEQLLKKNAKARTFFDSLSFTNKREYVTWLIGAKRPETRAGRRLQAIDKLAKGKRNPSEK